MPRNLEELTAQLSDIEPSEATYAGLGPEDVPQLQQLLGSDQGWLAARAVHALARVDAEQARTALQQAASSPRPEVRVALASAAPALPTQVSDEVLTTLLADQEAGVRKFAVRAVSDRNGPAVRERLQSLAQSDSEGALRALAEEHARTLRGQANGPSS